MSNNVYDSEAFRARVTFAANYISARRPSTRRFDTCFEMHDGDAVAAALVYRTRKSPQSKLAQNLFHYLVKEQAEECAARLEGKDLNIEAREMRRKAKESFKRWLAEQHARQETHADA